MTGRGEESRVEIAFGEYLLELQYALLGETSDQARSGNLMQNAEGRAASRTFFSIPSDGLDFGEPPGVVFDLTFYPFAGKHVFLLHFRRGGLANLSHPSRLVTLRRLVPFWVASGLRILQDFAGIFRRKLLICFVFSLGGATHNPLVEGSNPSGPPLPVAILPLHNRPINIVPRQSRHAAPVPRMRANIESFVKHSEIVLWGGISDLV
jgi:hypothetical protein